LQRAKNKPWETLVFEGQVGEEEPEKQNGK
jgi:hypothetical protein